ncbi:hypothetical protein E2C01_060102 [Portunus trituberculatus]|uniref:Uncharacterized protein n=1 Tax=Portunus trituberculatus TaxID=210409 RepID=A0A5B7H040_PORTR|nr:hypothetical protein [Portunus trituberculatus]
MANIFADEFPLVYTVLVPDSPSPFQEHRTTIADLVISHDDVKKALDTLDPNSFMGPDKLHPHL